MDASFHVSAHNALGGVVINMSGEQLSFFSTEVKKKVSDAIMSKGQRTIIQELEMMAALGALRCWQKTISQHHVVLFIDSEAVRGSFLKSWSANEDSDRLMEVIFDIEAGFDLPVWIEWVPSQSNAADVLSREVVTALGRAKRVEVDRRRPGDTPKALGRGRKCGCGGSVTAISPLTKREWLWEI